MSMPDDYTHCHGCWRERDGALFERIPEQCDETTDYYLCRECGVGVRTDRPEDPDDD